MGKKREGGKITQTGVCWCYLKIIKKIKKIRSLLNLRIEQFGVLLVCFFGGINVMNVNIMMRRKHDGVAAPASFDPGPPEKKKKKNAIKSTGHSLESRTMIDNISNNSEPKPKQTRAEAAMDD